MRLFRNVVSLLLLRCIAGGDYFSNGRSLELKMDVTGPVGQALAGENEHVRSGWIGILWGNSELIWLKYHSG